MKFTFSIQNPQQQYLQIKATIKVAKDITKLFFPAWRPGRYELGDFAKNVNYFSITDGKGNALHYQKENKNTWQIDTKGLKEIIVEYSYYSADLNAGSTYLDAEQLYVNPVNCCVFTEESFNMPIEVNLEIPKSWKIAHSLSVENQTFIAQNYDELADCPFICSKHLQHRSYTVDDHIFHLWFNGVVKPDWKRLINDFKAFTKTQIEAFGQFPTKEYHFLFQILTGQAYHGVEHSKSTVIALGPSYSIFKEWYKELLGVSSHELYHTWNIKAIRPKEMFPYDFKKENYSRLGYVAEGVTTYMGDLMLLKSGVFSLPQYLKEMDTQLQKHFDNFGRFNLSVADSSFDTWLDGYVLGVPNRKVSIYTEGCLLSFILDVEIIKATGGRHSLSDVMKNLFEKYALKNKGITEKDYQRELERFLPSLQWFFDGYVNGTKDYLPLLKEAFKALGLSLNKKRASSIFSSSFGGKLNPQNGKLSAIYPKSALDKAGGMLGDQIISVNGIRVNNDLDRWLEFFEGEEVRLTVDRRGEIREINLKPSTKEFYMEYSLSPMEKRTELQNKLLQKWGEKGVC